MPDGLLPPERLAEARESVMDGTDVRHKLECICDLCWARGWFDVLFDHIDALTALAKELATKLSEINDGQPVEEWSGIDAVLAKAREAGLL